jgi:hypothetical protein
LIAFRQSGHLDDTVFEWSHLTEATMPTSSQCFHREYQPGQFPVAARAVGRCGAAEFFRSDFTTDARKPADPARCDLVLRRVPLSLLMKREKPSGSKNWMQR